MIEINPEHLATRIAQFRDDRRALQEIVVACFPIGCRVRRKDTGDTGTVISTAHGMPCHMCVSYRVGESAFAEDVLRLERIT